MKKTIVLLILSCCFTLLYAQAGRQSANKAAQKAYEQADKYITLKQYDQAIEQLKQAAKLDEKFTAAWQQMGDLYRRQKDYASAKDSYKEVISINPSFYPQTYFGLGESELNTGDYEQALIHLQHYASISSLSAESKKLVDKYIADCGFSIRAIKNPVSFKPVNLGPGVNSKELEYLPMLTADEETLIFTRRTNNNEDFFKSTRKDGVWNESTYLSKAINSSSNEGAQYISPDGMYLFFTGCNRPDGFGRCDIYVSRREGKDWAEPSNLGAPVNTEGWESQPSLSADGRTLYFTSTRPGGLGGYDIWKSELKTGGTWTNPVNLGPTINTPYDEQAPFIHPDGQTLYFSSNGWPGLGNKDIFLSRKDASGQWQKPQNLGYPINTFKEESGLTVSTNGQTGFFSTDQAGGAGGLDIYSFGLPAELRPQLVTYVKGKVFDKKTDEPLNAVLRIINISNGKVLYDDIADYESGGFLIAVAAGQNIAFNASKDGYLFYSENFSLDKPNSANKPYQINVPLQKIEPGSNVALRNVFFETNKYDLLPESKTELNELVDFLNVNPKITIEIQGHTDNSGDDNANQILSENRAKSVYNYLVTNKINPSRLSIKGYGKTKPAEDNSTEEGRQKNRRTEFVILKI